VLYALELVLLDELIENGTKFVRQLLTFFGVLRVFLHEVCWSSGEWKLI
jgi:hypothetical protein